MSCIYQCKDTNFKANHNSKMFEEMGNDVVFTNAKILILKLITTNTSRGYLYYCCIYQCKDTNFKANHNKLVASFLITEVVFTNAKILILKLITTSPTLKRRCFCCIYQCKDTNFKANHNIAIAGIYIRTVVFTNAKILILKLITTNRDIQRIIDSCIYQCKDTNFKANHNL